MSEANGILPFRGWMLFIYAVMENFLLHLFFQCAEILALPVNQLLWNSVSLHTIASFLENQKNIKPSLLFSDVASSFDWFFFVVSFVHFEVTCISKSTEHPFSLQIMELFNRIREVCYGVRPGESCDRGSKTSILTAHCHSFFYIGVNPSFIKGNSKY